MKKTVIFFLGVIVIMSCVNLAAQNPFCESSGSPNARNTMLKEIKNERQKSYSNWH